MSVPVTPPLLLETFLAWTRKQPTKLAFAFLDHEGEIASSYTYAELFHRSKNVALHLINELELKPGDRVLLVFPPSLDFMVAFLGCLMAGVIAVPVFPPDPFQPKRESIFLSILSSSGAILALTSDQYMRALSLADIQHFWSSSKESLSKAIRWERIDVITSSAKSEVSLIAKSEPVATDVAFLQYTSGSTSEPKGVIIAHENLAHNLTLIITGLKAKDDTIVVSWLPQYHDMGLIGSYLGALYCGGCGYYLSPMTFIKNPILWVKCISRYRATHMQAPNFAYALTAKKFVAQQRFLNTRADQLKLDLSCVRHMINAAEPVDSATIETFCAVFGAFGLPCNVVFPTYGLAEHTVYVCSNGSKKLVVDKAALEQHKVVPVHIAADITPPISNAAKAKPKSTETIVGCGKPCESQGLILKIVDPESNQEVSHDQVGEIWLHSSSKAKGYWNLPEKSKEDFGAVLVPTKDPEETANHPHSEAIEYLRTGDLGFLHEGELFICGRIKDLIIIHGKNYYPHDIERCAEAVTDSATGLTLRSGCSAAFGYRLFGQESILFVAELSDPAMTKISQLQSEGQGQSAAVLLDTFISDIRKGIRSLHGISIAFVGLMSPRTIPKTSSGKIARQWVKKGYLEGSLKYIYSWNSLEHGEDINHQGIDGLQPEIIAPDAKRHNRLDPTGLPLSFVLNELRNLLAKCIQSSPDTVKVDIPVAAMGLDSAQGIHLQALLDERFTVSIPEQLMFEMETTLKTIATSLVQGGVYHHRPFMVRGIDVLDGEAKRNGIDNANILIIAFRMIIKQYLGIDLTPRKRSTGGNMRPTLPPQWFKENQQLANIDTLRFPDNCGLSSVPITKVQEYGYFVYALQLFGVFFWLPVFLLLVVWYTSWMFSIPFLIGFYIFNFIPDYDAWPPAFRTHFVNRLIARYYSYRTIIEAPIAAYDGITSIYAMGPHGVFGIGPTYQAMINGLMVGEDFHMLAAPVVFSFPFYGMLLKMLGAKSVERKSFMSLLQRGRSVGVIPGGIAEMFSIRPDEETMVIASRKGFVKIALETGSQIVPAFCFGNSRTFTPGSFPWLANLSRMLRTSIILFWGRFGLPIPHRVPLVTVLGRPIIVPKVENPSAELVHEYHEKYLLEMRRIYDTYKNTYNWQNRKMTFLSG
jgi:acyl-CoA synthetase (AMP-forming)/AMP-acid ligase II/1-acyl-sn-glycerol-3-phosphate acyltransferase